MSTFKILKKSKWLKVSAAVLMGVAVIVGATGCSTNAYELYKNAEVKTDAATTGVYDMSFSLENEIDTKGLTEEQLKAVNYMKKIEYKGKSTVDETKDLVISNSWVNLGGIGFDFTYYGKEDKQYIKYPVLKKYIDLKAMMANASLGTNSQALTSMPTISEATKEKLSKIWDTLATKDTVKSMEDVIIPTDQGDMKAKHLTLSVSGDAVKQALIESQKAILADEELKKMIATQMEKMGETQSEETYFMTENMTIEDFEISSYVNADGYLVKDEVRIVMSGFGESNMLKSSTFHMTTVYSQLNQKVELEFPNITEDQIFKAEELNQEMPSVFKDLIQ